MIPPASVPDGIPSSHHSSIDRLSLTLFFPCHLLSSPIRVKDSDSKSFYDTDETETKMFERDWQRACAKEKFTAMMFRENKNNKSDPKEDKEMLDEVRGLQPCSLLSFASLLTHARLSATFSFPLHPLP